MKPYGKPALVKQQKLTSITAWRFPARVRTGNRSSLLPRTEVGFRTHDSSVTLPKLPSLAPHGDETVKKIYTRPVLVKEQKLTTITASPIGSKAPPP